ncbi:MAG: type II toxin-antitoxin system VapC family toxin [Fibrobacteria bacterium]|nr:type II toxin-antitoxin system VapC family toxin [Fibrobacteria bacterium]
MNFLLDTCVISELIKPSPHKNVVQWISGIDEEHLFLSVLTIGELKKGISKLKPSQIKRQLTTWLTELTTRFNTRIIPVDLSVSVHWGATLSKLESLGKSMPVIDGLLACTALSKGFIMVTRNGQDMQSSGVEILNPWQA